MDNKSQSILRYNCVNAGSELQNVYDKDRSRDTCLHQPAAAQGLLLRALRALQPDRSLYEFKHTFHIFNTKEQYTIQWNAIIKQTFNAGLAITVKRERGNDGRVYGREVIMLHYYKLNHSFKEGYQFGHCVQHKVRSCSIFNHYKQIKMNEREWSNDETYDTTFKLN